MSKPLTVEEAQSQIAIQITGQTPEVQRLVMECVDLAFTAGYNSCNNDRVTAMSSLLAASKN
jgi:hypothetical protein